MYNRNITYNTTLDYSTPLLVTSRLNLELESLKLISWGNNFFVCDNIGYTSLHWSALNGHTQAVVAILGFTPYSQQILGAQSYSVQLTPMHLAFMKNQVQVVKAILYAPFTKQVDLMLIHDIYGNNPLHIATALESSQESIKALLSWAMDNNQDITPVITARNSQYMTPLHLSLRNNCPLIIQALLNPFFTSDKAFKDIFQLPSQTTSIVLDALRFSLAIHGIYQKDNTLKSSTCSALHTLKIIDYAMEPAVETKDSILTEFYSALISIKQQTLSHFIS